MVFPTAAVLFWIWLFLTPAMRAILWVFGRRLGRFMRLVIAHSAAFVVIVLVMVVPAIWQSADDFAFSGAELLGMTVMFVVAQAMLFLLDLWRMRSGEGERGNPGHQGAAENL